MGAVAAVFTALFLLLFFLIFILLLNYRSSRRKVKKTRRLLWVILAAFIFGGGVLAGLVKPEYIGKFLWESRWRELAFWLQTYGQEPYDVLVVGGEPEGIAAAVSAARNGARVLLIDKHKSLGGLFTMVC